MNTKGLAQSSQNGKTHNPTLNRTLHVADAFIAALVSQLPTR